MSNPQAETSNGSSGGIGLFGCIFTVFLCLKLGEVGVVAGWSWWWICSPLLIPLGLLVLVLLIIAIIWMKRSLQWRRKGTFNKKELIERCNRFYTEGTEKSKEIQRLHNWGEELAGEKITLREGLTSSKRQLHAAGVLLQESVEEQASLRHQLSSQDELHTRLLREQKANFDRLVREQRQHDERQAHLKARHEQSMLEDETSANAEYGPFELQYEDLEHVPNFSE